MSKKITSLLLALALVVGVLPTMAMAEVGGTITRGADFTDMPENWSTEALVNAVDNGLLQGADGKILPNDKLTRAEMATMINRAMKSYEEGNIDNFTDVQKSDWFYSDMAKAVKMGTFKGEGKALRPNDSITREEAFVVIARAFKIEDSNKALDGYKDLNKVSKWAKNSVVGLVESGYVQGSNGELKPLDSITRAEFAKLMDNMVKEYVSTPGNHDYENKKVKDNIVINTPGVVLKNLTIDGDIILGEGVKAEDVVLDNVVLNGRLVVRGGGEVTLSNNTKIENVLVDKTSGKLELKVEKGSEVKLAEFKTKANVTGEGKVIKVVEEKPEEEDKETDKEENKPSKPSTEDVPVIVVPDTDGSSTTPETKESLEDIIAKKLNGKTFKLDDMFAKIEIKGKNVVVSKIESTEEDTKTLMELFATVDKDVKGFINKDKKEYDFQENGKNKSDLREVVIGDIFGELAISEKENIQRTVYGFNGEKVEYNLTIKLTSETPAKPAE